MILQNPRLQDSTLQTPKLTISHFLQQQAFDDDNIYLDLFISHISRQSFFFSDSKKKKRKPLLFEFLILLPQMQLPEQRGGGIDPHSQHHHQAAPLADARYLLLPQRAREIAEKGNAGRVARARPRENTPEHTEERNKDFPFCMHENIQFLV